MIKERPKFNWLHLLIFIVVVEAIGSLSAWLAGLEYFDTSSGPPKWNDVIYYINDNIHIISASINMINSKAITQLTATSARITSATGQAVTTRIDGDPAVKLPIELTYLTDRFELIVPAVIE